MMNKKFKLFMCCLGNGITVSNSAVEEHGDYKQIAHISDEGIITYYVTEGYIPDDSLRVIEREANIQKQKFLSYWNSLTNVQKYEKLLDRMPLCDFLEVCKDKSHSLAEKVKKLEEKYIY